VATLTLEDVAIGYGYPPSVRGIDAELSTGQWVHVHGNNGVGKSTLLKVLSSFKKPLSGRIRWNDEPLEGLTRDSYRNNVRYFGHDRALFEDLTVRENWQLYSSLFGMSGSSDNRMAGDIGASRQAGRLSRGEKQRVELSTLWPSDSTVLIMDEPFSSLDQESRETLVTFLEKQREEGRLVVTASPRPIEGPDEQWILEPDGLRDSR
jgi:heme exporter protein A